MKLLPVHTVWFTTLFSYFTFSRIGILSFFVRWRLSKPSSIPAIFERFLWGIPIQNSYFFEQCATQWKNCAFNEVGVKPKVLLTWKMASSEVVVHERATLSWSASSEAQCSPSQSDSKASADSKTGLRAAKSGGKVSMAMSSHEAWGHRTLHIMKTTEATIVVLEATIDKLFVQNWLAVLLWCILTY